MMDLAAAHRVLDISRGHGVAVTLIAERPTTGRVVALDRSAKMVELALVRNALQIASGLVDIRLGSFPANELLADGETFTKLLVMHVPLFRDHAKVTAAAERHLLAPAGEIYLVGQPPRADLVEPWVEITTRERVDAGLRVKSTH